MMNAYVFFYILIMLASPPHPTHLLWAVGMPLPVLPLFAVNRCVQLNREGNQSLSKKEEQIISPLLSYLVCILLLSWFLRRKNEVFLK